MSSTQTKSRYKTKLHSLIAKGPVPSRRAWQDAILTYLTQNCTVSNSLLSKKKEQKLFFPSPLPVNVVPKKNLLNELRMHEHGDIPLLLAVRYNCTSDVIAALCHLFPDAAKVADDKGCLSLHLAAKRETSESRSSKKKKKADENAEVSKTIGILVEANPVALVSRDNSGRTPLHCLMENHAETRNLATVQLLGRIVEEKVWKFEVEAKAQQDDQKVPMPIPSIIRKKLPKQAGSTMNLFTPASALVIPDTISGALPLHHAVKNGATKEIIAYLIKSYPSSVCQIDCSGRTALHWNFGANGDQLTSKTGGTIPMHHSYRSSSIITMLLQRDPSQSYNVAPMKDLNAKGELHRTPLHYAVELLAKNIVDPLPANETTGEASSSCITLKSLKSLVEADELALITKDSLGQTPLHVLFRAIFERNDVEYKKSIHIAKTGATSVDEPKSPKIFSPPRVLLELLIEGTPNVKTNPTTLADIRGMLPLHCAVLSVASPATLGLLLDHNPKALTHLTKDHKDDEYITEYYDRVPPDEPFYVSSFAGNRTPLHMVFACPYIVNYYSDTIAKSLLFYDSSTNNRHKSSDPFNPDEESKHIVKIDASIALKMQDSNGETPLHLAAKNHASFERLSSLYQYDSGAAITQNNDGDLPLHLLLDRHFLFVNAELATAHSGTKSKDGGNTLKNNQHTPEFREKVRELAKKQTIAARMTKFQLCGGIFAPSNGWTNDDENGGRKDFLEVIQKINLLGMPLLEHEASLIAASSQHGLFPLHIMVAFHAAPYRVIHAMLQKQPKAAIWRSNPDGYTALDLHIFRKTIPGEIKKHEVESWKAIRQLLFSYEIFPLDTLSGQKFGAVFSCRKDKDTIADCEEKIIAELSGQEELSYHKKGNHPIDPDHIKLGFLDDLQDFTQDNKDSGFQLSDVCMRIWVFFSCYFNPFNPEDNYCDSLKRVLGQLSFDVIENVIYKQIPIYAFENTRTTDFNSNPFTIEQYANVYCKIEMNSHHYFSGLYDFTPPSNGTSILIHHDCTGQSILIRATQVKFTVNETEDDYEETGKSWMFNPATDVNCRTDFSVEKIPVCFKLTKNKSLFEREVNWRKELGELKAHRSVAPILATYDATKSEEADFRYAKDRQDERFRKLPLRTNLSSSNVEEWVNLSRYPFAVIFPYSSDGSLYNALSHGSINPFALKGIVQDMGHLLKDMHNQGLVHGTFSIRNILSFSQQVDKLWTREWKLSGLTSVVPVGQTSLYLGAIYPNGSCSFETGVLPPEMFKKLDSLELAFYNKYWSAVFELPNVVIPKELISPRIDPDTGDAFVLKCYCKLDDSSQRSLPPLPYDLVKVSPSVDIWSFGVFLFALMTGGEMLFQSNIRKGSMSKLELATMWNDDVATSIMQQYINDPVAEDLLLFLLSSEVERKNMDMNTILCHPFFVHEDAVLPEEITKALKAARDERTADIKLRMKKNGGVRGTEKKNDVVSLCRLSLRNQMLLVNSTTEVVREAFDSDGAFTPDVPYCYIVLPYKLAKNKAGKLTPTSMPDVELSERMGKQLLDLSKATCFASCLREFYTNSTKETLQLIHSWSNNLAKYPIQTAEEILKTMHLDAEHFLDIASKFVAIVRNDNSSFLNNPTNAAVKLVKKYIAPIVQIFSVNNKAYLYPVDELSGIPIVESKKGRKYPHTFRDCVADVVYKSLPYMLTCMTHMISASGGVEGLVKLIFEGAAPKTPLSWIEAGQGLPPVLLKRRMVAEARILRSATTDLIKKNSPVALNGQHELSFIHSLFAHIDSGRNYGGLKIVSDGEAHLWTSDEGVKFLKSDSDRESDPDTIFSLYMKEEEASEELAEKDSKIADLQKTIEELTVQIRSIEMSAE
mmetsp:Transcript_8743/g.10098  ORF Transcript_8743/g.10098 Transcript_8743/m.10098 type:complete len:1855 (+) Transcript_8743:175-5739(+)